MKLKEYKFEILIFFVEAICMILELVASRVLSPFFGSSQIVWTSVIAIILLSSSIGNYIGGKIADNDEKEKNLSIILKSASVLAIIIPLVQGSLINGVLDVVSDIRLGAMLSTASLFLAPSIFLGMVPPIILKLKLQGIDNAGKTSGKITAISTIGGIIGTILGGFFLVPNIGSVQILFVLALGLMILSFIPSSNFSKKNTSLSMLFIVLAILGLIISTNNNNSMEERVLNGEIGAQVSFDTEYGRALIQNMKIDDEEVRILNIDSGYESISYISDDKKHTPFSGYMEKYDLMFKASIDINDTLMIGGAGYCYPRYFISQFQDKTMDVVEIDGKIIELARKYFFLDDLINEYNLEKNKRLSLINEDGRTYLNRNKKKYDAILNDSFSGTVPAKVLTTKEAVQRIKDSLREDGLYVTNIIGSSEGENSRFLRAEVNTIKQVFKNAYVIPVLYKTETFETYDRIGKRNNVVIATDEDIEYDDAIDLDIGEDEIIITDDYCPVDTLVGV